MQVGIPVLLPPSPGTNDPIHSSIGIVHRGGKFLRDGYQRQSTKYQRDDVRPPHITRVKPLHGWWFAGV